MFKEVLRDGEALGSYLFYVLVAARSLIGLHWPFFTQMVVAFVLSVLLWQVVRLAGLKSSSHAMNALILVIVINNYYKSVGFAVFSVVLFGALLYGHSLLRKHKKGEIIAGVLIGLVSGCAALFVTSLFWR